MKPFDISQINTPKEYLDRSIEVFANQVLFRVKRRFRAEEFSYDQIYLLVQKIGTFFEQQGIQPQDRVLLIGHNSPELATLLLACLYHNRVAVPADLRSSRDLVSSYADLTQPKAIFTTRLCSKDIATIRDDFYLIEDLFSTIEPLPPLALSPAPQPDDLAEILFTSGTTGTPKGVQITHQNLMADLQGCQRIIPRLPHYEALSILPLSHIFEQMGGFLIAFSLGATINYVRKVNAREIKKALNQWPVSHLTLVPQILKNLYRGIEQQAEERGQGKLFNKMLKISKLLPYWMRRLVFRQVHQQLGGNINFILIGGAKLEPSVAQVWEAMGFPMMEGYGATEVSAVSTINSLGNRKIGSVGMPIDNVEVRIDENQEIWIKGPTVSPGYYRNPEKTEAVFTSDGWYRTGDMGYIQDRRLYISGRDAFRIVLSSGENIYVEDLESKLNLDPDIWDSCVIPLLHDDREQVHAVIIPPADTSLDRVKAAVSRVNQQLESHQQVTSHTIWHEEDFPRTHTLKVNRRQISQYVHDTLAGKKPKQHKTLNKAEEDPLISLVSQVASKPIAEISEASNIGADVGMDSIDRVELISLIEDEFSVLIDDYAITAHTTVTNLRQLIEAAEPEASGPLVNFKYFRFPLLWFRLLFWKLFLFPLHSLFFPTKIKGKQNLVPLEGPVIYAFNHIGPVDGLCFLRHIPLRQLAHTANAATENFWKSDHRGYVTIMQLFGGGFPVTADESSGVRSTLERIGLMLDSNFSIVLAPEGGMTRDGNLRPFKRGIGVIASEMGVPIVPIKLEGNYTDVLRVPAEGSHKMPVTYFLPRLKRANISIRVGQPLSLKGQSYTEATTQIEQAIRDL